MLLAFIETATGGSALEAWGGWLGAGATGAVILLYKLMSADAREDRRLDDADRDAERKDRALERTEAATALEKTLADLRLRSSDAHTLAEEIRRERSGK